MDNAGFGLQALDRECHVIDGGVLEATHHFVGAVAVQRWDANGFGQIPEVYLRLFAQQFEQRRFGFHGDYS